MDRRQYSRTPRIRVSIHRDRDHTEQLVGKVTKCWWGGPGVGGIERQLAEHWIDVSGMGEAEAVSALLMDLALALRSGLYTL